MKKILLCSALALLNFSGTFGITEATYDDARDLYKKIKKINNKSKIEEKLNLLEKLLHSNEYAYKEFIRRNPNDTTAQLVKAAHLAEKADKILFTGQITTLLSDAMDIPALRGKQKTLKNRFFRLSKRFKDPAIWYKKAKSCGSSERNFRGLP